MEQSRRETGRSEEDAPRTAGRTEPLAGYTVGVTAARRAEEFRALLERRGARVVHAPAIRTVPLTDDSRLREATRALIDLPPDLVVATTAVGFRGWTEAAGGWGVGSALLESLGRAEIYARGPKVRGAVRAAGLREAWSPASESMAEVLERLLTQGVGGRRIALQLHGEPLAEVVEALRSAGADVVAVPVYRWLPPLDTAPLDRLTDEVISRRIDALTFTSAPAVSSLLARAERRGVREALLAAMRQDVLVACVGPVTAAPLTELGIPAAQPERSRLGPLVQVLCARLPLRAPVAGDRRQE
jgi:uroporphyrinogen-III synthase